MYRTRGSCFPVVVISILSLSIPIASQSSTKQTAPRPDATNTGNTAANEWTWIGGSTTLGEPSVYGTEGVTTPGSFPRGTDAASTWTDRNGNLWLFGGSWLWNQLWKYSPAMNQWTWVAGSNVNPTQRGINDFQSSEGVYGTEGVPSAYNTPGMRSGSASWTDNAGNLWLFGGFGIIGADTGALNDLWEFNTATNQWMWVSGSNTFSCTTNDFHCGALAVYGTLGTPAAGNVPGGRSGALSWIGGDGNLWLFGGFGYDGNPITDSSEGYLNDIWKFDLSTKQWTWMNGSNTAVGVENNSVIAGPIGVPSAGNVPAFLQFPAFWSDNKGHFWMFGANWPSIEFWQFDSAINQWTWLGGNTNCSIPCTPQSVFGTLGVPAPGNLPVVRSSPLNWTDNNGNLWLLGGYGYGAGGAAVQLNDLWKYNPAIGEWAWMGGSNAGNSPGVYGTLGTPWPGNVPGSRQNAPTWTDQNGNLWLFGGIGIGDTYPPPVNNGDLNDLWVYQPSSDPLPTTATPVLSAATGSYNAIQTVSMSDDTHGTIIYYTTDGSTPTTNSAVYSGPLTVSTNEQVQAMATASGCYPSETTSASYTITNPVYPVPVASSLSPAFIAAPGAAFTLTVNGAGFSNTSTVLWQGTALPTQALSATQITAQVPATDVVAPGIFSIQVQSPAPGGGTSQMLQFEVDSPYSGAVPAPVFSPSSSSVAAGSTATYAVTLPSSATSVSVQCLNLPSGAACSYSTTQGLSISTKNTTAPGSYQITVVFTETLPITVGWLLPFALTPLLSLRRGRKGRWIDALLLLVILSIVAVESGCGGGSGGGGGGSSVTTTTPTHQVTRSGTVTLVIH